MANSSLFEKKKPGLDSFFDVEIEIEILLFS